MKKSIKLLFTALTVSAALIFTGCINDLYGLINEEVSLETGISGDIYSIVRFGDSLYLSNGKIYQRSALSSASTGLTNYQWNLLKDPTSSGQQFLYLASDDNYLYALVIEGIEEDDDGDNIETDRNVYYSSDGIEWKPISFASGTVINTVFGNNAIDKEDRHAYVRLNSTTPVMLNGASTSAISEDYYSTLETTSYSCTYFNGHDYFTSYDCVASRGVDSGDYCVFYSKYKGASDNSTTKIYASTAGGSETEYSISDTGTICSISVTQDYLLLGTTSGLARVAVSGTTPSTTTTAMGNNGGSIFSVYALQTFALDPSAAWDDNDFWASATIHGSISSSGTSFTNTGLYAYYSYRGNWNKDGTASGN